MTYSEKAHGYSKCNYIKHIKDQPKKREVQECPACGRFWVVSPVGSATVTGRKMTTYESTLWMKNKVVPRRTM